MPNGGFTKKAFKTAMAEASFFGLAGDWQSLVPLEQDFFAADTLTVAPALVGCLLIHQHSAGICVGRIVETEAYKQDDPACHAYDTAHRFDPKRRSAKLFGPPGFAYVYFNYGVHWMLNVVTEPPGVAGAVLIRAVEPILGVDLMFARRGVRRREDLASGPGKLFAAFAIDREHHGMPLTSPPLFFARHHANTLPPIRVAQSTRIGISKGLDRPWRFFAAGNPHVSRGKVSKVIDPS